MAAAPRPTGTSNLTGRVSGTSSGGASASSGGTQVTTTSPVTTTSSGSSTTNQTQVTTSNSSSQSTNMSGSALKALDTLIAGLMSGSTEGALAGLTESRSQWSSAVRDAERLQSDYTKANAFADSKGAVEASLAEAMSKAMPTIAAGIDAAGTSGGSMAALLAQQAATDSGREAARLGLDAAIAYGNISVAAGQTLAGLAQSGDPTLNALLDALNIAKGAVSNTKSSAKETVNSTSQQTTRNSSTQSGGTQTTSVSGGTGGSTSSSTGRVGSNPGSASAFVTAPSTYRF